jgi:uncharacterized protein (TIRG00374 family)
MSDLKERQARKDFIRILPGILISLIALVIILLVVDWRDVLVALQQAHYSYLLLGLPIYLAAYVFRALGWRTLLKEGASFKRVFLSMQTGYLLNNILPFRLGELGRAFLLGRSGLPFWRVFSTILIERAFDLILAAGLLLGTIPFVWGSTRSQPLAYGVVAAVLLGMIALHLLARYQDWVVARYERLGLRWPIVARFGPERLSAFFDGLAALVRLSRFLRVLGWMLLSWGTAVIYQYILLLAFVPGARPLWAGFGLATASLGVALPSSPSYIGIFEGAWIGALAFFEVPFSTALAYAIIAHVLHILISVAFGVYTLSSEGETIGQVYDQIRKKRSITIR